MAIKLISSLGFEAIESRSVIVKDRLLYDGLLCIRLRFDGSAKCIKRKPVRMNRTVGKMVILRVLFWILPMVSKLRCNALAALRVHVGHRTNKIKGLVTSVHNAVGTKSIERARHHFG